MRYQSALQYISCSRVFSSSSSSPSSGSSSSSSLSYLANTPKPPFILQQPPFQHIYHSLSSAPTHQAILSFLNVSKSHSASSSRVIPPIHSYVIASTSSPSVVDVFSALAASKTSFK